MTTTTSPRCARRAGRAGVERRPLAVVGSSTSVAARAAERAVSGRRAPGIGTTTGDQASSQASATSSGVASRAAASSTSAGSRARRPARRDAAERRVGDQRDPELLAALEHTAPHGTVVEQAQRHLHRGDRSELERLVELPAIDVRDADVPHEPVADEPRERAHGGAPRHAWVGRVDEKEVDR